MYKRVGVIVVLIFLASCSNHRVVKEQKNFIFKWMSPKIKENICKAYGGFSYPNGYCAADWQTANDICSAIGGELASKKLLTEVVVNCGGDPTSYTNKKSYRKCYKEKGFMGRSYWSSTIETPGIDLSDKKAWTMDFYHGYIHLSDIDKLSYSSLPGKKHVVVGVIGSYNTSSSCNLNANMFRCVHKVEK